MIASNIISCLSILLFYFSDLGRKIHMHYILLIKNYQFNINKKKAANKKKKFIPFSFSFLF